MGIEHLLERSMGMSEAIWARHANPWSVWTRIASWPFVMLALWSPHWLNWWSALPIAAVAVWAWLNPRLFEPPETTDTWASKGTFGERVWLARDKVPIPAHHARAALATTLIAGFGSILMLGGAILGEPAIFLVGGTAAFLGKMWFVDRMVWLYEDMKHATPEYRSWLY